ncbi:MAG: cytidylate kinase-like family protein [Desulfitobacteriaceae bacterium]|nr:cytidylate kinase-like family protein [Desulfitobacteriaceae bacterium]MDD4345675.1 cytidylate kinase-like family protein [Desulfitobacteriaceae bacterium]MDD4400513.1 cytidylate kinase-like family protein [Desulfitobacteriaceae bacterium]
MKASPYVITISRQLGSGGSYIGRNIAKRMGIYYLDREILREVAQRLQVSEQALDKYDEKAASFWQMIFPTEFIDTISYVPPKLFVPSAANVFETQADIINKVADERSAVIIGRGGHYILRNRPKHLSIFIHAGIPFRQKRIVDLYEVSEKQALKMIEQYDNERAKYIRQVSGLDWLNACNYQLCIDTGGMGIDNAVNMIVNYIKDQFGVREIHPEMG